MREELHQARAWAHARPLRWRLVVGAALAAVLAIAAAMAVAYLAVQRELVTQLDTQLSQQAGDTRVRAAFPDGLEITPGQRLNDTGWVQVVLPTGTGVPPQGQPALPVSDMDRAVAQGRSGPVFEDTTINGTRARMLTQPLTVPFTDQQLAVQVALPLESVLAPLRRLAVGFGALGVFGTVLAGLLAWLVARRALSPVAELTQAAEEIAATQSLAQRIYDERGDELGRLARSFNRMLDALASSVRAQRQLVADASHELRTPLASLRTNVEVLRRVDHLAPQIREEVISAIVAQLEELTALVTDVVELARGDEAPEHLDEIPFDRLVAHAVERSRRHWPEVSFELRADPVVIHGVANRLDRAVNNLLDNAAKFSPPGGVVQVRLESNGTLAVRDHGPGVPAEALPHVFDRFYRADEARGLPGSGLGLAIVKQVAERHRGQVVLGNAPDGGAVSVLRIPPAPPGEPAPRSLEAVSGT